MFPKPCFVFSNNSIAEGRIQPKISLVRGLMPEKPKWFLVVSVKLCTKIR